MKNHYHLVVLGAYKMADGYYALTKNFDKYFKSISFFPLMIYNDPSYTKEYYDKCLTNCLMGTWDDNDHIINIINTNVKKTHVIYFNNYHYLIDNLEQFYIIANLKNNNFKLYMINWDANGFENNNIADCFDVIYQSYYNTLRNNVKPLYTGYIEKMSYHERKEKYSCDVAFIGTTLYDEYYYEQNIKREKILDSLTSNGNIITHIYTNNDYIKNKYSSHYKGYICYAKSRLVYSNALFTLNISPMINVNINGHYYYSERLPQILACGGIMISNNNYSGLLEPDIDYIYVENVDEMIEKILFYKNNLEMMEKMRNSYKKKLDIFNYDYIIKNMINDFISND